MNNINPTQLLALMRTRRSIRKFLPDAVADEDITAVIEAASWAPSGTNQQNWAFIAVRSVEVKEQLARAVTDTVQSLLAHIPSARARAEFERYSAYYTFFAAAPVVIAVVQKPYDSLARRIMERFALPSSAQTTASVQGPAAAVQNLLLMAHARGLGACWMTGPLIARPALETALGVTAPDELMALIPLGKPAVSPPAPSRNDVQQIVTWL